MNSEALNVQNKVGDFVNHNPDVAARLFAELNIDFCCGGSRTLAQACEENGLDPNEILNRFNSLLEGEEKTNHGHWTDLEPSDLIDHIIDTHHQFLNKTFPQVEQAMKKVLQAHGKNHPELLELSKTVQYLIDDLSPHMIKEEQVLFPMIKKMETESDQGVLIPGGSIKYPIQRMLSEHENAGQVLEKINTLTHKYTPPADACETFKHLYRLLKQVEEDTHLHVHKENNILFPQALELAA